MSLPPLLAIAEQPLPVRGRTPRARQAGASGAEIARRGRGKLQRRYLALLLEHGPQSDQEAADALHVLRCSINSTRGALVRYGLVEDAEQHVQNRATKAKNERWKLTPAGQQAAQTVREQGQMAEYLATETT